MPFCKEHGHVYGEGCQCPDCAKQANEKQDEPEQGQAEES